MTPDDLAGTVEQSPWQEINPSSLVAQAIARAYLFEKSHPELADRLKDYFALTTIPATSRLTRRYTNNLRATGMHALLAAHNDADVRTLLDFVLGEEVKDIEVITIGGPHGEESFAQYTLRQYSDIVTHLDDIAKRLAPDNPTALRNDLLTTANNLLRTTIAIQNQYKHGEWTHLPSPDEETAFHQQRLSLQLAFRLFRSYLLLLQNPASAPKLSEPYDLARFQDFNDLDNSQRRAVYDVVVRYFFAFWGARQQLYAPYAASVEQITTDFYRQLPALEEDASQLTADTELNRRQLTTLLLQLHQHGLLPTEEITVLSNGIRSGRRIDLHCMQALQGLGHTVHYFGTDLTRDPNVPPEITVLTGPSRVSLQGYSDHFDIALNIWPGWPTDTLLANEVPADFQSTADSLKPGGIFVLEVPLPLGNHSYRDLIQNARQQHRAEQAQAGQPTYRPPDFIEKGFATTNGGSVFKPFHILDPEKIIALAHLAGLEVVNFPASPQARTDLYHMVDANDSCIGRFANPLTQAIYCTGSGFNRIYFVFVKASPETAENIRSKLPVTTSRSYSSVQTPV